MTKLEKDFSQRLTGAPEAHRSLFVRNDKGGDRRFLPAVEMTPLRGTRFQPEADRCA